MQNQFGQIVGEQVLNWTIRKLPGLKEIRGNFCVLKPLNLKEHGQQLFNAFKQTGDEIYTYLPCGPFPDYISFENAMKNASSNKVFFSIIDYKTNQPQGVASYWNVDLANGVIEVGHIIYSKALQNTAAGTEAMYLMAREVFNLGYRRYEWKCNSLNQGSRNAALRLGFTFEGIFRQHYVVKGHNRDTAWYSIIDDEWPAKQSRLEKWLHQSNFDKNGQQIVKI